MLICTEEDIIIIQIIVTIIGYFFVFYNETVANDWNKNIHTSMNWYCFFLFTHYHYKLAHFESLVYDSILIVITRELNELKQLMDNYVLNICYMQQSC